MARNRNMTNSSPRWDRKQNRQRKPSAPPGRQKPSRAMSRHDGTTSLVAWMFAAIWMFAPASPVFGSEGSEIFAWGDDVPSFRADVMAVLSKGGCNMGACHGNQNGKGGFQLSLRGQDPHDDY